MAKTKSTKSRLKEWSLIVRTHDHFTCQLCGLTQKQLLSTGKKVYLNAHHIIEKTFLGELKFDPRVGITVCPRCHKYYRDACHSNPLFITEWLRKNRPKQFKFLLEHTAEIPDAPSPEPDIFN